MDEPMSAMCSGNCLEAGWEVWVLMKMGSEACGTSVEILAEGSTWMANGWGEWC